MRQRFKHIIIMFYCLFVTHFLHAQSSRIDSLKKALTLGKADANKINALLDLCNSYRFSYPDSSLGWARQALLLAQKIKNDTLIFWSYVGIGSSLYPLGNFSAELDNAYKLQPVSKRLNTLFSRGYSSGSMSDAYLNFGEYNTCLYYWRKVVYICEREAPRELPAVYGNSAYIFARANQFDSALFYGKKAFNELSKNDDLKKDIYNIHFYNSNISEAIGEAFAGMMKFDSALYYCHISLQHAEIIDMRFNTIDASNAIAKIYKKQGLNDSAIFYCKKVLSLDGAPKRYPISVLKTATILASLFEIKKEPDSSLKYMHLASDIKDSVYSREKTSAFQNIIFKNKEKENEISIATEKLRSQYRMYFLIAAFIAIIIIAAIIIRNRRIKQLQIIRNSIADDLHDDIGSTLSSISIMNELAKVKSPEALPLLTSIGESTAAIQENMSDIVWTVNPNNDHFENLLQRMQLFATEISDAKNIRLEFNSDASLNNARLSMKQRKNLYLFFKEAINNAAKHSGAKKITVRIYKKDTAIEIQINDDGSGFNTSGSFNGNGMSSLKKRSDELNAVYYINSQINSGTTAQLKFKIT